MKVFLLLMLISLTGMVSTQAQTLHHRHKDLPCVQKHFNLHVHLAEDSLRRPNFRIEDLSGPIAAANRYFAPICVSFSVCAYDTMHNYNFDSLDNAQEANEIIAHYQSQQRINVYVLDQLDTPTKCGFASASYVFLKKACPGALTHELGHLFGLPHTFITGDELVDGSNSNTANDAIVDTPADPFIEDTDIIWQNGCEFTWEGRDANGQYYRPDMGNIMSYYGCDCGFTRDQYLKMVNTILNSAKRFW